MKELDINTLIVQLNYKLYKSPLNPRYCLSKFKVGNEDYRHMPSYTDPRNYLAYYYLACHLEPKKVLEIGFDIGIESGCFLTGCLQHVEYFLGFHHKTSHYWSSRISRSNVANVLKKKADHWIGNVDDSEFLKKFLTHKWDCILITEITDESHYRKYLDLAWSRLDRNGVIVFDNVTNLKEASKAYSNYCDLVKRKPKVVKSRNGMGILIK